MAEFLFSLNCCWTVRYFFRASHCRTLGHMRHSSGMGVPLGMPFSKPEKWAHLAGESKTFGYSVALMPVIRMFSVVMSILDMQWGQAKKDCRGTVDASVINAGLSNFFSHPLYGHRSCSSCPCEWKIFTRSPSRNASTQSVILTFNKRF